jgi:hypothetical protein
MKIRPVGAELFNVDRQTDGKTDIHDEANSRFSQFCKRASNLKCHYHSMKLKGSQFGIQAATTVPAVICCTFTRARRLWQGRSYKE